jgi:hypothetical protein
MGDQTNGSSQVISLPQGGCAVHGIGEKFSPDLHTGTGNFTVPIALPPWPEQSPSTAQPRLQHRTWKRAMGTRLGLERSRRHSEDLERCPEVRRLKGRFHRIRGQKLGSRDRGSARSHTLPAAHRKPVCGIDHYRGTANDYWEVRSKNGLISLYGTPRQSDVQPGREDPAVICTDLAAVWSAFSTIRKEHGRRRVESSGRRLRCSRTSTFPTRASFFSPPTETRTRFHRGPVGDEFGDLQEIDFTNDFWAAIHGCSPVPPVTRNQQAPSSKEIAARR